jgi:sulfur relay protein TusB/DsrH
MSVLFVVGRFQESVTAFRLAEEMARDGAKIDFLFTRKGCLHATDRELIRSLEHAGGVHCLKPDCEAEVILDKIADGVKLTDYDGWVRLLEGCGKIVSWI